MSNKEENKKVELTHEGDIQASMLGDIVINIGKTIGLYGQWTFEGIKKVVISKLETKRQKIAFISWLSVEGTALINIFLLGHNSFLHDGVALSSLSVLVFTFPTLTHLIGSIEKEDKNAWFIPLYKKLGFKEDLDRDLKYPYFLEMEIDNKIKIYKFLSNGNRMDIFEKNKDMINEYLTNQFSRYNEIIEISRSKNDNRIIELKAIGEKLETFYRWGTSLVPKQGELLIGKTLKGDFIVKWKSFYNLLICGEIGGGKSVATKNIIFQLLHQSITGQPISIAIADHKGAVDYNFLRKYITIITEKEVLLKYTKNLIDEMKRRTDLLIDRDVENANEYNDLVAKDEQMKQIVFIIDEIVECFDTSDLDKKADKEEIEITGKIKSNITKLARLARFVNINLILATQVPSMEFLGNQLRTNIPARLTGKMSDASSASMVSKKASEIDDIAGRMVWKRGTTVEEVQTPFINNSFCKSYLQQMGDKLNLFELGNDEIRERKEQKEEEKEITLEELQKKKLEKKQNKDISNE